MPAYIRTSLLDSVYNVYACMQPFFTSDRHRNAGPRGPSPQTMVPKIKEALNFMRNHSFEVPYIANYRREYVEPELDVHDLWKVYQWDEKVGA